MKGLHKLILTHFESHQLAKWTDPKARSVLAKVLVKKIKEHLQGLDWKIESGRQCTNQLRLMSLMKNI